MKTIKKLKLTQLSKADLEARQMSVLMGGGDCCGCGCHYANSGGSSIAGNGGANDDDNKHSIGGDLACGKAGEEIVIGGTC